MKLHYQARDIQGGTQTGIVEASSKEAALQLLARRNLYVTLLEEAGKEPWYAQPIRLTTGISLKDLVAFSRQLSIMFRSQVPLVDALHALASEIPNLNFKEKIIRISEEVEAGTALSAAFSKQGDIFTPLYINMVKSGEASGKLSEILEELARHLEREYDITRRIKGAMLYPAFVVALSAVVMLLMVFFVAPALVQVLKETGGEIPTLTKAMIVFTDFVREWALILSLFFGVVAFLWHRYIKSEEGRRVWHRAILRVPLLSSFLKMLYLARFSENLSTLIAGGISITQALEVSGAVIGNTFYQDMVLEIREAVSEGKPMSSVLRAYPRIFPPLFTQMVAAGEKSGNLEEGLLTVSNFYQKEVDGILTNLLTTLEPLLIIILGLGVGLLMAAVVLPLYQVTSLL